MEGKYIWISSLDRDTFSQKFCVDLYHLAELFLASMEHTILI